MPITVQHQPDAGTIGQLAYSAGIGEYRKWLRAQKLQEAKFAADQQMEQQRMDRQIAEAEKDRRFKAERDEFNAGVELTKMYEQGDIQAAWRDEDRALRSETAKENIARLEADRAQRASAAAEGQAGRDADRDQRAFDAEQNRLAREEDRRLAREAAETARREKDSTWGLSQQEQNSWDDLEGQKASVQAAYDSGDIAPEVQANALSQIAEQQAALDARRRWIPKPPKPETHTETLPNGTQVIYDREGRPHFVPREKANKPAFDRAKFIAATLPKVLSGATPIVAGQADAPSSDEARDWVVGAADKIEDSLQPRPRNQAAEQKAVDEAQREIPGVPLPGPLANAIRERSRATPQPVLPPVSGNPPTSGGAPVMVQSAQEYAALPQGAAYLDRNGRLAHKGQ